MLPIVIPLPLPGVDVGAGVAVVWPGLAVV